MADLIALDAEPRPDLAWRHGLDAEVLDPARRTREIRNFISKRVKPVKEREREGINQLLSCRPWAGIHAIDGAAGQGVDAGPSPP